MIDPEQSGEQPAIPTPEHGPEAPSWDQAALERDVHELGLLYGLAGLDVVTRPGAGWKTILSQDGQLSITIDPLQSIEGHGQFEVKQGEDRPPAPELTSVFITAHELGHAKDMLEPNFLTVSPRTSARQFFDNFIDDTVIDTRSRRVPRLNDITDEVYAHSMPPDLTDLPKHAQLMVGLRMDTVMRRPNFKIDPQVAEIIESFKHYEVDGITYSVMDTLTDPRTSLADRRQISENIILPHFEALLRGDKTDLDKGRDQMIDQQILDLFEEIYKQLEDLAHAHRHASAEGEEGDESSEGSKKAGEDGDEESDQSGGAGDGDSIDMLGGLELDDEQDLVPEEADEEIEDAELPGGLAGAVANELGISPDDASEYIKTLQKWTEVIRAISQVFLKIAAITNTNTRPGYRQNPSLDGERLHPQAIAEVALQIATDQELSVWQPIVNIASRENLNFGGLDFYLVVDVSSSMSGPRAVCASDTTVCLIEGLQIARNHAIRTGNNSSLPDVRTEVIAFGSSKEVLSPLSYQPNGADKGRTYTTVRYASSGSTNVAGALSHIQAQASSKPERDNVIVIVSDGDFGDHSTAAQTVRTMPRNVYVSHIVIDDKPNKEYICDDHQLLKRPNELPSALLSVLNRYIRTLELERG